MAQQSQDRYFERHIARLLIVLYSYGRPLNHMFDAETRQVDSIWPLQRFDFWVREPGHLALALLSLSAEQLGTLADLRRTALDAILAENRADLRRVPLPGAPYNVLEDFDRSLSYLTSRALVSDRPTLTRSRSSAHQIILESAGIELAKKILADCPSFAWYRAQCETVLAFFSLLEGIDLTTMPYLAPDLTPAQAATEALTPIVQKRYDELFGVMVDAVV